MADPGHRFRFLLPGFLPLQTIYLALIIACNGGLYASMQASPSEFVSACVRLPAVSARARLTCIAASVQRTAQHPQHLKCSQRC